MAAISAQRTLDYIETLVFSKNESKAQVGQHILQSFNSLVQDVQAQKNINDLKFNLSKKQLESIGLDIDTVILTMANKEEQSIETYQKYYKEYRLNPMNTAKRRAAFCDLKYYEDVLRDRGQSKYLNVARGEHNDQEDPGNTEPYVEMPFVRANAFGRNGIRPELNRVYTSLAEQYSKPVADALKMIDTQVLADTTSVNTTVFGFVEKAKDEKEKDCLLYTAYRPAFKQNKDFEYGFDKKEYKNLEKVMFRIYEDGKITARYEDPIVYETEIPLYNEEDTEAMDLLYQDDKPSKEDIEKAKKIIAKNHKDEFPDVSKMVFNAKTYELNYKDSRSIPSEDSSEKFTSDITSIKANIANDRLLDVTNRIVDTIELSKQKQKQTSKTINEINRNNSVKDKNRVLPVLDCVGKPKQKHPSRTLCLNGTSVKTQGELEKLTNDFKKMIFDVYKETHPAVEAFLVWKKHPEDKTYKVEKLNTYADLSYETAHALQKKFGRNIQVKGVDNTLCIYDNSIHDVEAAATQKYAYESFMRNIPGKEYSPDQACVVYLNEQGQKKARLIPTARMSDFERVKEQAISVYGKENIAVIENSQTDDDGERQSPIEQRTIKINER